MILDYRRRLTRVSLCLLGTLLVMVSVSDRMALAVPSFLSGKPKPPAKNRPMNVRVIGEDPLVHAALPPAAKASLATKLGWCEVQMFGRSFSDPGFVNAGVPMKHMHIDARFTQLNNRLKFAPDKSGLQLMNDMDAIVKAVCVYKKIDVPAETAAQTPAASTVVHTPAPAAVSH